MLRQSTFKTENNNLEIHQYIFDTESIKLEISKNTLYNEKDRFRERLYVIENHNRMEIKCNFKNCSYNVLYTKRTGSTFWTEKKYNNKHTHEKKNNRTKSQPPPSCIQAIDSDDTNNSTYETNSTLSEKEDQVSVKQQEQERKINMLIQFNELRMMEISQLKVQVKYLNKLIKQQN